MISNNNIRVFNPNEVTTIDKESECDPSEIGLKPEAIDTIWDSVVDFYSSGIHPAISICIRRHGKIILNRAIGHTHGNELSTSKNSEKIQATPDSLFNLFSASKAITAMVIHHMAENELIKLDDPFCNYLPEFEKGSKKHILISQALSHESGVPTLPADALDLDKLSNSEFIRSMFIQTKPKWRAGKTTGYHALSGGFIFAELVRVITGLTIREYLEKYFLEPLKFKHFNYGVPQALAKEVAPHVYTGIAFPKPIEELYVKRLLGVSYKEAIDLSNDERFLTGIIPSANIIGTAEETSRFYEMLLRGGTLNGVQVLKPETIQQARKLQVDALDRMIGIPIKYSQGFMLGRKYLSMYGNDTAQAFGHIGFINVVGYADPARDISVGIMNNGKPGMTTKIIKFMSLLNTISATIPKTIPKINAY